jgi:uncharacterized protein
MIRSHLRASTIGTPTGKNSPGCAHCPNWAAAGPAIATVGTMSHTAPTPAGVDAESLRTWLVASLDALSESRAAIDSLNVFPIADGDTGTNMYLTVEACVEASESLPAPVSLTEMAQAVATGALWGARGNSGVIVSEALRGIFDVIAQCPDGTPLDLEVLSRALRTASDRARASVSRPVEGTILTVARVCAETAEMILARDEDTAQESGRRGFLRALLEISAAAHEALARTTDQLPVLRDAGVVDAGAQGLVVIYDTLIDVVTGVRRRQIPVVGRKQGHLPEGGESGTVSVSTVTTGDYEVMFVCDADEQVITQMRSELDAVGDSLVVSGGPATWSVHVHVDDAGAALEACVKLVQPQRIRITYLPAQVNRGVETDLPTTPTREGHASRHGRALVAQVHGPGIAELLAAEGVTVLAGRPQHRPSTGEFLEVIRATGATEVVVLPSDGDSIAAAEIAAEQARGDGHRVSVIPTRSIVQSLAAVSVHEASARFDDVVVAMADAASATGYGAVTIATKDALTSAGHCHIGDVLGLVEGDIVLIGSDVRDVAVEVGERLLSRGGEVVTLLLGEDAPEDVGEHMSAGIRSGHPGLDIEIIEAGQPLWPIIIGVE